MIYTNCLRFADILGLHLSDVKTFKDEVHVIPRSAFQDLVIPRCPSMATVKSLVATHRETQNVTVVPMFDHQAAATSFSTRLTSQKVIACLCSKVKVKYSHPILFQICLETFSMAENDLTGAARVVNLGFHKQVTVRWTVDRWKTSSDLEARYVDDLSEGLTDTFVFRLSSGLLCRCLLYTSPSPRDS